MSLTAALKDIREAAAQMRAESTYTGNFLAAATALPRQ